MALAVPILFAGVDLARRVEAAERSLIESAARCDGGGDAAAFETIAGGLAVWAGPESPFNKVVGAGVGGPIAEADLDRVEAMFDRRGCPTQFEIPTLADPSVLAQLSERGYVVAGCENVLGLPLDDLVMPPRPANVDVLVVDPTRADDLDRWVDVDVEASAAPDKSGVDDHEGFPREALERATKALASADGFVASLALVDGTPAGSGSMRIVDGLAQLCGAATLPAMRRRGVQSALLTARLEHAAQHGCDLAVVTVRPGSISQRNVQRLGFQVLYARIVLTRPGTDADLGRQPTVITVPAAAGRSHPIETGTGDGEAQFLEERIYEHNCARTGRDDGATFTFVVRGDDRQIVAGVDGWTWAGACQIENLWVHEAVRGHGYGLALLERAEQHARECGCTVLALNSYSFQAPGFYERNGYELVHRLREFPPGHDDNWLAKRL